MVNLQHVMDVVERILEVLLGLFRLSQGQFALAYHLGDIVKTGKIIVACLSQFPVEGIGLAKGNVVALHVAKQAEIILTGIIIALEIALVIELAHVDAG